MSRKKTEIYQTFLASLKGGGVPPVWQKTKLFPVFSCEGFPKLNETKKKSNIINAF